VDISQVGRESKLPVESGAAAVARLRTAASEAGIGVSTPQAAPGAKAEPIGIRGGVEPPVSPAAGAFPAGQTAEVSRIDTQVEHSSVELGQSESWTAERQAAPGPILGQESNHVAVAGNPAVVPTEPAPVPAQISTDQPATKSGSASIQALKRTTRGTDAAGVSAIAPQAQPASASGETASAVRDLAGVQATANPTASQNGISSAPSSAASIHETFAALDAEPSPGAITWTHAGARQAEAGFEDPALGWVGVRADLNGGGVHATLQPGSAEAAQALGQHMEGLSAYMAQQHTPVESLAMAAPEGRGANQGGGQSLSQGTSQDMGQSPGSGPGQGTGQGQGGNAQTQSWAEPESSSTLRTARVDGTVSDTGRVLPAVMDMAQVQSSGGMHLSLVA
jgi:hypothetical protein